MSQDWSKYWNYDQIMNTRSILFLQPQIRVWKSKLPFKTSIPNTLIVKDDAEVLNFVQNLKSIVQTIENTNAVTFFFNLFSVERKTHTFDTLWLPRLCWINVLNVSLLFFLVLPISSPKAAVRLHPSFRWRTREESSDFQAPLSVLFTYVLTKFAFHPRSLTRHFTISESQNPPINVSGVHRSCR